MGNNKDRGQSPPASELRRKAEARVQKTPAELSLPRSGEETRRLVHELEVHQVELEMQNAELRQARDEVEKTLGEYTDLYDFAPVGYVTFDRNGTIRGANLTFASLLGIERFQLIGRRFDPFIAPDARAGFTDFLAAVFAESAKKVCEVALLKGGPPPRFVRIEAVAATSGEECRAAIIDMSVRRQLEEMLEALHEDLAARATDLEAANVELEAFNYSVSHDLRTPLTTIVAYAEIIGHHYGAKLGEKGRDFLRQIINSAMCMNGLINTLLDFSCIKQVEIRREEVDLSKMAEAVAKELQDREPERRAAFHIPRGLVANGDASLLRVVLDNLLGNAWKYSHKREETIIAFGVTEVDGKPAYFVKDNGPGFDMADAGKLFIPFQRLHKTGVEGHGIGLATVERIVRRHGGRVWAESQPNEGAVFYFTLQ